MYTSFAAKKSGNDQKTDGDIGHDFVKINVGITQSTSKDKTGRQDKPVYFVENVDQNQLKIYKSKFQRTLKEYVPRIITMEDIKNVVTYLLVGDIPKSILLLFHSQDINGFCRALILYFQLYLQIFTRNNLLPERLMIPLFQLYKAQWYWKDGDGVNFNCYEKTKTLKKQLTKRLSNEDDSNKTFYFLENVDQNQQKIYKFKYQRTPKASVPNVVTIQDIKDTVTYLLVGKIPLDVLGLFHCQEINELCRALTVYTQLYLLVWNDLLYRRTAYANQRLKHPISVVRETLCRTYLSELRRRIGQEYALIITGEGKYKNIHHMNNTINRSYTTKDIKLYDYIFTFCTRVVWVALGRSNYKDIETEIARLFCFTQSLESTIRMSKVTSDLNIDINVLRENNVQSSGFWRIKSPAISELFTSTNEANLLLTESHNRNEFGENTISGLEAALKIPEELLAQLGIQVGILGKPRDNFEPLLHAKQEVAVNSYEKEIESVLGNVEEQPELPSVKMYEFLRQLQCSIDLSSITPSHGHESIKEDIQFYLANHAEDGKKSYRMWKKFKFS